MPTILHETADWLVLHKPAGWHTVARKGSRARMDDDARPSRPDVESWLRECDALPSARGLDEAGLVHRLDCETSGCLVVAKSAEAQQRLRHAFQTGDSVRKVYRAIASSGDRLPARGEVLLYFSSRYRRSKKVTVREDGDAQHEGCCAWRVVRQGAVASPRGDLVEVELIGPGRRHQIRAGFAYLGHPLLGDRLYGGPTWPHGLALQATRLNIEGVVVECPMPEGWGIRGVTRD